MREHDDAITERNMTEQNHAGLPLEEDDFIQIMALADGELDDDPTAKAQAEALLARSEAAATLLHDLQLAGRSLKEAVMTGALVQAPAALDDLSERVGADLEAMRLMAYVDGELADDLAASAEVEALIASSPRAAQIQHDLGLARTALQREVMRSDSEQDMTMVRGRIMTHLPAPPRAAVTLDEPQGLLDRLRETLFGRPGLVLGLGLAALLLALALGQVQDQAAVDVSLAPDQPVAVSEPAVIIEEMEIDSGTVLVDSGEEPGAATIIWHYQDDEDEGAG